MLFLHFLKVLIDIFGTYESLLAAVSASTDGYEANSLVMNVAGKIMMLQKDRPAAERGGKQVCFTFVIA